MNPESLLLLLLSLSLSMTANKFRQPKLARVVISSRSLFVNNIVLFKSRSLDNHDKPRNIRSKKNKKLNPSCSTMLLCYFNSHPSFLGLYIIVIVDLTHITIDPK
jgi:hypothetical protein